MELDRPFLVRMHNDFMGEVDVADLRRLFCESRIPRLRRWWIRVFLHLINVATGNALIVHNAAKQEPKKNCINKNMFEFKRALVHSFAFNRMETVEKSMGKKLHNIS